MVLLVLGVFGWAVFHDQFDGVESEGQRILDAEEAGSAAQRSAVLDPYQDAASTTDQESGDPVQRDR